MSLMIRHWSKPTDDAKFTEWHIGESVPPGIDWRYVELQADGDELNLITLAMELTRANPSGVILEKQSGHMVVTTALERRLR